MDVRREFTSRTGESDAARIERIVKLALDDQIKNQHIDEEEAARALAGDVVGEDEAIARRILDAMLTIYHIIKRLHIDF